MTAVSCTKRTVEKCYRAAFREPIQSSSEDATVPIVTKAKSRHGRFLFVHSAGGWGLGEYVRCVTLARELVRRRPEAEVRILCNRDAPRLADDPFERIEVEGQPSRNTAAFAELLRSWRPDVAVFYSTGRRTMLRAARAAGVRVVYAASRDTALHRALRGITSLYLDELWQVQRRLGERETALPLWTRIKLRLLSSPAVTTFDAIVPAPDPGARLAVRHELGLGDAPYALFAPGGGGWVFGERSIGDVFAESAERTQAASGVRCVVVLGPLSPRTDPADRRAASSSSPVLVRELGLVAMNELIAGAEAVAVTGGGTCCQALVHGRPCVAAPVGDDDQPERVRRWGADHLVVPAEADAERIASAMIALLRDPERQSSLHASAAARGPRNGLASAVDRLEALASA